MVVHIDRLRGFIAFAECMNFTHAARAIHISQPALFAQIKQLEQTLGVDLYQRDGRKLVLTEQGLSTLGFAREMCERTRRFRAELLGEDATTPVELCAGRGSYLYLLGDALRRHRSGASVPIKLHIGGRDQTLEAVRSGHVHLGVLAELIELPPQLTAERITRVPSVVAFPSSHRLASKRRVRLRDLDGESLIVAPPERGHRATVERALRSAGVRWDVAVEADGWDLMLHFVALGVGVAIVNGCCRLPRGVRARRISSIPTTDYHVVTRHLLQHPEATRLKALIVAGGNKWKRRIA